MFSLEIVLHFFHSSKLPSKTDTKITELEKPRFMRHTLALAVVLHPQPPPPPAPPKFQKAEAPLTIHI